MTSLELEAPLGRTLREQVLARLREAIINGELAPGEPLKQDQLAELLGVSSTPIREALADLAREQLVDLEPNRGARVRPLTHKTALDLADTYRLLFLAGYEWGLPRMSAEDFDRAMQLSDELRKLCCDKRYDCAFDADAAVHRVVLDAAGNVALTSLITSMRWRVQRLIRLALPQNIYDQSADMYDRVFEHAREGRFAQALELLAQAWDGWRAVVDASVPDGA